ncbi:MAG: cytidine deaminase [Armatimonadetes bacterium]|nr:cytidine deaminase [Armatimonadota bacterium]NIM23397.1 cytidine deaminase [Armatimonadota bacterium]NIM67262.1 cytidine deaminase [Armatimonadota bacterium]NIM75760.1 cytidine deaminase [Armatimonadota bacterium]NIN05448.1 cytidine deaminase [Armatimonadota bacterium]
MKKANNPAMEHLLRLAHEASKKAHAPYSNFPVGAALADEKGEIFLGANVENVSLGLTICAERSAVACAIAGGASKLKAIAIYSPEANEPLHPCGACLQVLAEFAEDMDIYSGSADGKTLHTTLKELLPRAFRR